MIHRNSSPCDMHNILARHYTYKEGMVEIDKLLKTTVRICGGRGCRCESSVEMIVPNPDEEDPKT